MAANIVETLPWIDYRELYEKLEERGKSEGIAEGKAEGKAEGASEAQSDIALKAFTRLGRDRSPEAISRMLGELEIPKHIIEAARDEASRINHSKKRPEPER